MCFVLPKLEENGDERDDGAEEFAGEFDAGVIGRHGGLGHAEGAFSEEIIPEAGAGEGHFDEAGDDGEDEIPEWEFTEIENEESDSDDGVEEEPKGCIK